MIHHRQGSRPHMKMGEEDEVGTPHSPAGTCASALPFSGLHHADTDVAEAGRGGAVAHAAYLYGLAFAAIGHAPQHPGFRAADTFAAIPELGGYAGVGAVLIELSQLATLYLVGHLSAEL